MKTFDYLKILAERLAKKGNKDKIDKFKIKLDIFLTYERITFEEYMQILEILEPKTVEGSSDMLPSELGSEESEEEI